MLMVFINQLITGGPHIAGKCQAINPQQIGICVNFEGMASSNSRPLKDTSGETMIN